MSSKVGQNKQILSLNEFIGVVTELTQMLSHIENHNKLNKQKNTCQQKHQVQLQHELQKQKLNSKDNDQKQLSLNELTLKIKQLHKKIEFNIKEGFPIQINQIINYKTSTNSDNKKYSEEQSENVKKLVHKLIQGILTVNQPLFWEILIQVSKINCNHYSAPSQSHQIHQAPQTIPDNTVIALHYGTQTSVKPLTDISEQQNGSKNVDRKQYYKDDDNVFTQYLNNPFKVVAREEISDFSLQICEHICEHLVEPILNKKVEILSQNKTKYKNNFQTAIYMIQLLDSISPPIYSFYLLNLFNKIVELVQGNLNEKHPQQIQITKEKAQKIIYGLYNIAERWTGTVNYSNKWEWIIKSKCILALLNSPISQSKLTAVKMMIDVFKKSIYSGSSDLTPQIIRLFIHENAILEQIYSPDNHPEVINKGRQIYELICRQSILTQKEIDILLNLLDKSHENVCQSIYVTLQSLGEKNLQQYYQKILKKVVQLPRPSCYCEQTIQLIEVIMLIAPTTELQENMINVYKIINSHYLKLKKSLKERLVRLYFQMFIMGVEEKIFDQKNTQIISQENEINEMKQQAIEEQDQAINMRLTFLEPIANSQYSQLTSLMMHTFVRITKNQVGKFIYNKCRKIVNKSIYHLFRDYKIHKKNLDAELLSLIKFLLETYQYPKLPLTYEETQQLIEIDISFSKFIQFYSEDNQKIVFQMVEKQAGNLDSVIELASLMSVKLKDWVCEQLICLLINKEMKTNDRNKLGDYIFKISNINFKDIISKIIQLSTHKNNNEKELLAYLTLFKKTLYNYDKKGYSKYLPYKIQFECYQICLKVTNSLDSFNPIEWQLKVNSYENIGECLQKILQYFNIQKLSSVKIKLNNQKYLAINDLTTKIDCIINQSSKKYTQDGLPIISIIIFQSFESGWFDKGQLMDNQNILHQNVVMALKQIFVKYAKVGRIYRQGCASVFQVATQTQKILETDSRIEYIFNYFSQNGQFLNVDQWLNFYQKSGEDNPSLVIDNLKKLGYTQLFRDEQLLKQFTFEQQNEIRKYIAIGDGSQIYQVLFLKYKSQDIKHLCKELLQQLPILPQILTYSSQQTLLNYLKGRINSNNNNQSMIDQSISISISLSLPIDQTTQKWYFISLLKYISTRKSQKQNQQVKNSISTVPMIDMDQILKQLLNLLQSYIVKAENNVNKQQKINKLSQISLQNLTKIIIDNIYQTINNWGQLPKQLVPKLKQNKKGAQYIDEPIAIDEIIKLYNQNNDISKTVIMLQQHQILKAAEYQQLEKLINIYLHNHALVHNLLIFYLQATILRSIQKQPEHIQSQIHINYSYIFHENFTIRQMFNNFYYLLSSIYKCIKKQYYEIDVEANIQSQSYIIKLNAQTPNLQEKQKQQIKAYHCSKYFETVNKMLRGQSSEEEQKIYSMISGHIQKSISSISHAGKMLMIEDDNQSNADSAFGSTTYSDDLWEQLLMGKLQLLDSIKIYQPDLQVSSPETWVTALINQSYTNQTKTVLYRIANNLCSVDYNLEMLKQVMNGIEIKKNSFKIRKSHQKMGLYNLGCICYINSTIQQLFMIEPFRRGIIQAFLPQLRQQTYFHQFQNMIYQLTYGRRQFFIPDKFCLTYTDYQNQPINIRQQHDADQFLNSLFDRLEQTMKQNKNENVQMGDSFNIIKQNFCGKMANIIHCQSCLGYKIKIEDFYVLSLQIKNNKNLMECLDKLSQPQIITDYFCEQCDRKVESIHKYHKLKQCPAYLFIHFQRLVFDLESLMKLKLQNSIQYPQQISLNDYLYNDQAKQIEEIKYKLRGFIVHVGTSDSGHYYSLVKDGQNWIKFDDSRVSVWDWYNSIQQRQGAYMLIYQRVYNNSNKNQLQKRVQIGNKQLHKNVMKDNQNLINQTTFLQGSFAVHLQQTLSRISIPHQFLDSSPNKLEVPYHPQNQVLPKKTQQQLQEAHEIIINYLRLITEVKNLGVISYQYNQSCVRNSVCYLVMAYHLYPRMIKRGLSILYMESSNNKISDKPSTNSEYLRLICTHSQKLIRQSYKLIFIKILSILASTVNPEMNYSIPAPDGTNLKCIQNILQQTINMLPEVGKNYLKMTEYFEFVLLICGVSEGCITWLQNHDLGPKLIHFILQDKSPLKDKLPNYNSNLNNYSKKTEPLNLITKIISIMIHKHYFQTDTNGVQKKKDILSTNHQLCEKAFTSPWYLLIFDEKCEYQYMNRSLAEVIQNCSSNNSRELHMQLCTMVISKLNRYNHEDSYIMAYLHLFQQLIKLNLESSDKNEEVQMTADKRQTLEWLLGIPRIFLPDSDIIRKKQDNKSEYRYYKYWNPRHPNSDEIIQPFLQLLFINRHQVNYFTLIGSATLLRLFASYPQIQNYVLELPAPEPYPYYYQLINLQLSIGIKGDQIFAEIDKKRVLNQIAGILTFLEAHIKGGVFRKLSNYSDEQDGSNKSSQNIKMNVNRSKILNPSNTHYYLNGKIQKLYNFEFGKNEEQSSSPFKNIALTVQILSDNENNKIIKNNIKIVQQCEKLIVRFSQKNYHYTYYFNNPSENQQYQITIPYQQETIQQLKDKNITNIHLQCIKVIEPTLIQEQNKDDNNMMVNEDIKDKTEQPIGLGGDQYSQWQNNQTNQQNKQSNNQKNKGQQMIECPFCMNISYGFVSQCPSCGEEWGAFM